MNANATIFYLIVVGTTDLKFSWLWFLYSVLFGIINVTWLKVERHD